MIEGLVAVLKPVIDGRTPRVMPVSGQFDQLWPLAYENHLGEQFSRALRDAGTPTDRPVAALTNGTVLHITRCVHTVLDEAKIAHVFFKGPLQQKQLYEDFFVRSSSDVDVLVERTDFARARQALESGGFFLPPSFKADWWQKSLGEQHLFLQGYNRFSVDLHHKIQQPGAPAPRQMRTFLFEPDHVAIGGQDLPTLSLQNILLCAAMNLVKALVHREACGNHALDLLVACRRLGPAGQANALKVAANLGLKNTLRLAATLSARAFDAPIEDSLVLPLPRRLHALPIADIIFRPRMLGTALPRRRLLLATLCDRALPDFPLETARWFISENTRFFTVRQTTLAD